MVTLSLSLAFDWRCVDKPKRPPGREPQPEGAEPRSGEEASTMATGAADSDVVAVDDDAPASAGAADANATTPTPPMVPVAEYERSWFQRFSPAFCIRVRQGSMLIGSSTLPVLMSFNFGRVDGITTTIPVRIVWPHVVVCPMSRDSSAMSIGRLVRHHWITIARCGSSTSRTTR